MKKITALILALIIVLSFSTSAFAWRGVVQDLSKFEVQTDASSWAVDELKAAKEAGLLPALTGNPGFTSAITREQFAELTVNMVEKVVGHEIAPADASTFTDCTNEKVLKANAAGIVDGVGNNKFAPERTTNREQIATMIARAIKYIEKETGVSYAKAAPSLAGYTDASKVSSWAVDGVGLLAANKIMNGTSTTRLSPKNSCTVEQSVLLIYRFYNLTK